MFPGKTGDFISNMRNKQKRKNLLLLSIGLILALTILISLSVVAIFSFQKFANQLMGSENCVISHDYSTITYYDEKYVPLDTKGYECPLGEQLIREARLEGEILLGKLLFGDSIYSVKTFPDSTVIYLQSDYDLTPSDYYVKASKLDDVQKIIDNATEEYSYAVLTQDDGFTKEFFLNDEFANILNNLKSNPVDPNVNCEINRSRGQEHIPVIMYESNHLFYKSIGELLYKNNQYYWYDYNEHPFPHPISKEYYQKLDKLFSYMYK